MKREKIIYSEKLLNITTHDDACRNVEMQSTGKMYYSEPLGVWVIEFYCPQDGLFTPIWMPQWDALTQGIAHDELGDDWRTKL